LIEKHVYKHRPQFEYWWDPRKNKNIYWSPGANWTKWHDLVQVSKHLNIVKQIVKLQHQNLEYQFYQLQSCRFKAFDIIYQIKLVQGSYGLSNSIFYMLRKPIHRVITLNLITCRHHWELNGSNITNVQNSNLGFFQKHIRVFWLSPLLIIPTNNYYVTCIKLLPSCTLVGFL